MTYQLNQDGQITGSNGRTLNLALNQRSQTLTISIEPNRPGAVVIDLVILGQPELQELLDVINTVQGSGFASLPGGK